MLLWCKSGAGAGGPGGVPSVGASAGLAERGALHPAGARGWGEPTRHRWSGTLPRWKRRRSCRGRHRTGPAGKHRARLFSQLLLGKHTPAVTGHLFRRGVGLQSLSEMFSRPGEPLGSRDLPLWVPGGGPPPGCGVLGGCAVLARGRERFLGGGRCNEVSGRRVAAPAVWG